MHHHNNEALFSEFLKTRNPRLRSQIAQANERLVFREAHKFLGKSSDTLEDLISVGSIGLLKAIDSFDPSKGFKFSSYAVSKIRGELMHHLRDKDHSGLLAIPRKYSEAITRIKSTQKELAKVGRTASVGAIARSLGFNTNDAEWIERYMCSPRITELSEAIEDIPTETATSETLLGAIAHLPKEQRESLILRYYGDADKGAIAKALNSTVDQVESYLQSGIAALREMLGGVDGLAA